MSGSAGDRSLRAASQPAERSVTAEHTPTVHEPKPADPTVIERPLDRSSATPTTHFPNLDGYRAIGMMMIMVGHVAFATGIQFRHEVGRYFARFDIGLPIFFILSAFLLYRPFVLRLLQDRPPPGWWSFFRRRLLRILPGYWAALVFIALIFGLAIGVDPATGERIYGLPSFGQWVMFALFLQTATAKTAFYGITQSWSIAVEMVFYLLLPAFAVVTSRWLSSRERPTTVRRLLALCVAIYLAGSAFRCSLVVFDPPWAQAGMLWFPSQMDFFALGMAMAIFSAAHATGVPLPRPLTWVGRHPATSWLIALGFWLIVVNPWDFQGRFTDMFTTPALPLEISREYVAREFIYGFAALFFLLPAMFGDQSRGRIRWFLRWRPVAYLGAVSYAFYLWHMAWIRQAELWTGAQPFSGNFAAIAAITLVGTLTCAVLSYHLIELPFLRLKDGHLADLFRRNRSTPRGP